MDAHRDDSEAQNPRIESFRSDCILFGDFNRLVFLEEIERFIESANKKELANLRTQIARRAKNLAAHRGNLGRPRGDRDPKWFVKAKIVAWRRHVDEWPWPKIAESEGMNPSKENVRTLSRRRDKYAAMVWEALTSVHGTRELSADRIDKTLDHPKVQQWLWIKASVPFRWFPHESKKLVQGLVPLGPKASAEAFARQIDYLTGKRAKKAHEPGVKNPL